MFYTVLAMLLISHLFWYYIIIAFRVHFYINIVC